MLAEAYTSGNGSGDCLAQSDAGALVGIFDVATFTCLEFDTIVPVTGIDPDVLVRILILDKATIDAQAALVNGSTWQCTMRCTKANATLTTSGVMAGSFTFLGGLPTIEGPVPARREPTIDRRKPKTPIRRQPKDVLTRAILDGLRRGLR